MFLKETKKIYICIKWCSYHFTFFFFLMGDCFDILFLFFKIQFLKVIGICSLHVIVWMTSPLFWPRMERHSLVKHGLPACPWKRHCIFFLLMLRAMMDDRCFAAVVPFFSLSLWEKVYICPFFSWFFNYNLYVFYCLFSSLVHL
jgi:hypothetical protein